MVFATNSKERNAIKTEPIKNFLGLRKSPNLLDMPLGQLVINKNMEYQNSGDTIFLRTKRGSVLTKDIIDRVRGAGNYIFNLVDNFLVWVDISGNLKFLDEGTGIISTLTTGLTTGIQNHFVMYGAKTASSIYIANNTDGIRKVDGSTPTHSTITGPNLDAMAFSTLSGRMFGVKDHTIFFSEIQLDDLILTNLENWAIGTNNAEVSPDDGMGFVAIVELSQAMFMFKDSGIWAHPNANEAVINWVFPKMNADTGTMSPKTVRAAKYGNLTGIIYLGSDKTLRFLSPNIVRNAGKIPSITNNQALIISRPFESILDEIPDTLLDQCSATYHNNQYILTIPESSSSTDIDKTIIVDTSTLLPQQPGDEIPQPFVLESENMNYTDFVIRKSDNTLFGFNKDGYISKVLVENIFTEGVPTRINAAGELAIEYEIFTGWHQFTEQQISLLYLYIHLKDISQLVSIVDVFSNAFLLGEEVPEFDSGNSFSLTPLATGKTFWNKTLWNKSKWAGINSFVSQNVPLQNRGQYFLFGVRNTKINQPISLFGFEPVFRADREDVVGKRF